MNILTLGEIVGRAGITAIKKALPQLKNELSVDLTIANGEGATGGFGLGKNHALYLHKLGIDIITIGEKGFYKKDMVEFVQKSNFILRPLNYPPEAPGYFYKTVTVNQTAITIICAMGLSGFERTHLNNPFTYLISLMEKLKEKSSIFIVEFHGCTTAEKYSMLHLLKGKAAVLFGSHTKALSGDIQILENTGFICDTGRCGSILSVGGFDPTIEVQRFLTAIPSKSGECFEELEIQGALFTIDENGHCTDCKTIRHAVPLTQEEKDKFLSEQNQEELS